MVICPVRVTYNHVMVFFAQERKTEFKLANRATFGIAKSLICLKFNISFKKYTFLLKWRHVQSAVQIITRLTHSHQPLPKPVTGDGKFCKAISLV